MSKGFLNVAVLGVSLLFALAVAEVALRVFGSPNFSAPQFTADSALAYRLRSNVRNEHVKTRNLDYRWSTNSQGLRGTREFSPKPAGARRVVAIGDSFTFGLGVEDAESYPAMLENGLRGECNSQVEVVNAGVGGYNTSQQLETYERVGRAFNPDLVILGFATNDFDDLAQFPLHTLEGDSAVPVPVAQRPKNEAARRFSEWMPGYTWLVTHSALADAIRQLYYGLKWKRSPVRGMGQHVERATEPHLIALERGILRRLQKQVAADSAELLVLLIPDENSTRHYLRGHPDSASAMSVMRGFCTELSLTCVDMGEWLVKNMPGVDVKSLYIQGDGHVNATGMRAITKGLLPLTSQLLGCQEGRPRTAAAASEMPRIAPSGRLAGIRP